MTTLYCADCEGKFEPDDNHVRVTSEHVRIDDRNDIDDHVFHEECWRDVSEDWVKPA